VILRGGGRELPCLPGMSSLKCNFTRLTSLMANAEGSEDNVFCSLPLASDLKKEFSDREENGLLASVAMSGLSFSKIFFLGFTSAKASLSYLQNQGSASSAKHD